MDIARIAEEIAASYLRQIDPTDGVVREAAEENEHGKTWVALLRPDGDWVYLIGYIPELGWSLVRTRADRFVSGCTSDDIETLGVHATKVNAAAIALAMMEEQG